MITLFDTSSRFEPRLENVIDYNGIWNRGYTTHEQLYPISMKTQLANSFKKLLVNSIISLAHIEFEYYIPSFPFKPTCHRMKHLIGNKGIIGYKLVRHKDTLVWRYDIRKDRFQSICYDFCYYFIEHIAENDRSEVSHLLSIFNLKNRSNESSIDIVKMIIGI